MHRRGMRLVVGLVAAGALLGAACSSESTDNKVDTSKAATQVKDASAKVSQQVKDAWGKWNTDSASLIDQVQNKNDTSAKTQLQEKCTSTQDQVRKTDATSADNIGKLCDKIKNGDVNNKSTWDDIKKQIQDMNKQYGG